MNEISTRKLASILRKNGYSVKTGKSTQLDSCNAQIIGKSGTAVVLNSNVCSRLGFGCFSNPSYKKERDQLSSEIASILRSNGIEYVLNGYDQFFLSGYTGN